MTIIKQSFDEGRSKKVTWVNSESKKKLDVQAITQHNIDTFNDPDSHGKSKKIQQIDPDTGIVLAVFPNQSQASRWIINNIMAPKNENTRAKYYQINGNLKMSMLLGYASYGYYWKIMKVNSRVKVTVADYIDVNYITKQSITRGRCNKTYHLKTKSGQRIKCATLEEFGKLVNRSHTTVARLIRDNGNMANVNGVTFYKYTDVACPIDVNEMYKFRVLDIEGEVFGLYSTAMEASHAIGISASSIYKSTKNNVYVKGYKVEVLN